MKLSLCLVVRCLLYDPPSAESDLELICVQCAESWLTRLVKSETIWRSQVKVRRSERHNKERDYGAQDQFSNRGFHRGDLDRCTRFQPERESHRRRQKGRQDRRLRLPGVSHGGRCFGRFEEKNRYRGGLLARLGDQSDGPRPQ